MKEEGYALRKIVLVHWRDANTRGGWGRLEDYENHGAADVLTAGWLLKKTKDTIVVASSQGDWADINQAIAIPSDWVISVRQIGRIDRAGKLAKRG